MTSLLTSAVCLAIAISVAQAISFAANRWL